MLIEQELPMECRLICLDIDGTLLNSRHEVTEHTKCVIGKASKMGIPVVLVSARMPSAMTFIRDELGLTDPVCSYGGALIMRQDEVLVNHWIPAEVSAAVWRAATGLGIHVSVYRENGWYVQAMDEWALQEGEITRLKPTVCDLPGLLADWERHGSGANKLLLMSEPEKIREVKEALTGIEGLAAEIYRSKDTYLEIMPEGIGKKEAVEDLCRLYGIPVEAVLAAGDNDNDKQMIRIAGIGVAMGNAHESVKECADFVTKSNDEDGVAYAIEKFVLAEKIFDAEKIISSENWE